MHAIGTYAYNILIILSFAITPSIRQVAAPNKSFSIYGQQTITLWFISPCYAFETLCLCTIVWPSGYN
jgi:hypothetical protein